MTGDKGSSSTLNYDDATFSLLFKDELQEREVARLLLEHGFKKWDEHHLVADHIIEEMETLDDTLVDNQDILRLIKEFKQLLQSSPSSANPNYFIYHPDQAISTLAVSLMNSPYEESGHWRREFSQASGYQKNLFDRPYEEFIKLLSSEKEEELMTFLKMDEDSTKEDVDSTITYLKLRKVKRLLLENQLDLEKSHTPTEYTILHQTHQHLKKMEIDLTKKMGAVIIK